MEMGEATTSSGHGSANMPAAEATPAVATFFASGPSGAPAPGRPLAADRLAPLIAGAQAGDRAALGGLMRMARPQVERQLTRYPVSDDDRLDLIQSTLLQIVRRIGSFRGDSSFATWLFRVTANEALMLMRSQRRQRARIVQGLDFEELSVIPDAASAAPSEDDVATIAERERAIRQALRDLPADYREIVVAHYHDDLGLNEIARRFMVSESAVRSRLHRARLRLKAILTATASGRELSGEAA